MSVHIYICILLAFLLGSRKALTIQAKQSWLFISQLFPTCYENQQSPLRLFFRGLLLLTPPPQQSRTHWPHKSNGGTQHWSSSRCVRCAYCVKLSSSEWLDDVGWTLHKSGNAFNSPKKCGFSISTTLPELNGHSQEPPLTFGIGKDCCEWWTVKVFGDQTVRFGCWLPHAFSYWMCLIFGDVPQSICLSLSQYMLYIYIWYYQYYNYVYIKI